MILAGKLQRVRASPDLDHSLIERDWQLSRQIIDRGHINWEIEKRIERDKLEFEEYLQCPRSNKSLCRGYVFYTLYDTSSEENKSFLGGRGPQGPADKNYTS